MIQAAQAIQAARALLGTPYGSGAGEIDCINLIKKIIRTCPGGVKNYTTSGSNGLWKSRGASEKYRDVIAWRTLENGDSGRAGEILAMVRGESCDHVGLCVGDGTVIHASKSHGAVVCTDVAKNGWTHALTHRYIEVEGAADEHARGTYTVRAGGGLRQRQTPGGRYMQMIPDGAQIEISESRKGWGKTVWRGFTGWVSMDYVKRKEEND